MREKAFIVSCFLFLIFFVFLAKSQTLDSGNLVQKTSDPLLLSIARGKIVYQKECLSCHQEDGRGVPRMFPTLVNTKWVLGKKETLIGIVLKGSAGEVEIEGETFHNVMAPNNKLTDRQIADVLTYIRNSFGNKVVAVNAAEVKAARVKFKKH